MINFDDMTDEEVRAISRSLTRMTYPSPKFRLRDVFYDLERIFKHEYHRRMTLAGQIPEHHHTCDPRCTCPKDVWWRCFQHWVHCPATKPMEETIKGDQHVQN